MANTDLIAKLRAAGLAGEGEVRLCPLPGGVSSDISLVETATAQFVIKSALPRLKVKDEWFADVSRNGVEQAFLSYAAGVVPSAVPRVLAADPTEGWFAMEYLGAGYSNWKQDLLQRIARPRDAHRAGEVLGRLHHASWGDNAIRAKFSTLSNFHALRIEPYLLTAARRVPVAADFLAGEAERLAATEIALVHGDYSPKNLLISGERLIVLDAEVAWFGDPAFDVAFLLNHLLLKALLHHRDPTSLLALVPTFWDAYGAALGARADGALEGRVVRLLLCLMLARVHGKSPAEYLWPVHQRLVTGFVTGHISRPPAELRQLTQTWQSGLARL